VEDEDDFAGGGGGERGVELHAALADVFGLVVEVALN
jgi:hypothetical protein